MYWVSAGSGPAVLLLHAFPLDGRMWERQIADLAPEYRVLAPDIDGFGRSARPDDSQSIEEWARAVVARCRADGVDRAVVAGCSMGGYIAFAIARRAPEFLAGLALIDTRAAADSQEVRRARYEMVERARHEGTGFLRTADPPLCPYTFANRRDTGGSDGGAARDGKPQRC
jgi:3-oxoadipate enol-lactonase